MGDFYKNTREPTPGAPPLYENIVLPFEHHEEYSKGPYDNPLTVGLMTSVPVPEFRPQPQAHTIVIMPVVLGHHSARMNCPHCLADISTGIRREPNVLAYVACLLMFLFGLWCCCFIPFCLESCKDTEHKCPNCNRIIGRRN